MLNGLLKKVITIGSLVALTSISANAQRQVTISKPAEAPKLETMTRKAMSGNKSSVSSLRKFLRGAKAEEGSYVFFTALAEQGVTEIDVYESLGKDKKNKISQTILAIAQGGFLELTGQAGDMSADMIFYFVTKSADIVKGAKGANLDKKLTEALADAYARATTGEDLKYKPSEMQMTEEEALEDVRRKFVDMWIKCLRQLGLA